MGPRDPDTLERTPGSEESPRFTPLRRATTVERGVLFIIGPLLWLGALLAVSYVVRHGEAVLIALVALGGGALLALVTLVPMWIRRVHREREP